jgi:hypothetical protein
MAPDRIAHATTEPLGWIGTAILAVGSLGGFIEWIRRRLSMIGRGWQERADQIEARVEVELQGQHTMIAGSRADIETRLAKLETDTHNSIQRLHDRLDHTMSKDDGKRIEDKVDRLLDKFVNQSFGGRA